MKSPSIWDTTEAPSPRYLNKLVELGLLRRSELNREAGGVVNIYHSIDLERTRRETLLGFHVWAGEAAALIEDANVTKRDYLDAIRIRSTQRAWPWRLHSPMKH